MSHAIWRRRSAGRERPIVELSLALCGFLVVTSGHAPLALDPLLGLRGPPLLGFAASACSSAAAACVWRFAGGPFFDNQIATLSLEGREASLTISKAVHDPRQRGRG